jgi:hypothetical protein
MAVPIISRQVWNRCVSSCRYSGAEEGDRRTRKCEGRGPLVAWSGTLPTQRLGIHLPELPAPRAHGLIGQDNSTLQPQLFDIPRAQTKAEVEPHPGADDFCGQAMALVRVGYGW